MRRLIPSTLIRFFLKNSCNFTLVFIFKQVFWRVSFVLTCALDILRFRLFLLFKGTFLSRIAERIFSRRSLELHRIDWTARLRNEFCLFVQLLVFTLPILFVVVAHPVLNHTSTVTTQLRLAATVLRVIFQLFGRNRLFTQGAGYFSLRTG